MQKKEIEKKYGRDFGTGNGKKLGKYLREKGWDSLADLIGCKKEERFCCWCGKIEYTELCESESMKEAVDKAAELLVPHLKSDKKK